MKVFAIWLSYVYVAGTAVPFIFSPGLHAWEPLKEFIPFLGFIPVSLNEFIFIISLVFAAISIPLLLARKLKKSAALFIIAVFFAAIANYYRTVDITAEHHITNFLDQEFFDKTLVRGTIIADPDKRESFTNIVIAPDEVVPDPVSQPTNVIKLEGRTGYIRAKVYPSIGDYYNAISYGDRVEIVSSLNDPPRRTNPAGFDFARFLRARNIYATTRPIRTHEEIKHLGQGHIPWIWRIALGLKERILLTIRKTMPYPESAFLGGVTLGLRGGVPRQVRWEFQATGVAHVLAVSGLHVGFVAILLMTISRVVKLPSKISFVFVVFGLIVFTIITGASPATRRAAIMFSMMDFFRSFLKMPLGRAGIITIPVTAMIILIFNPLKLPDASFALSFMAVWSLVMITGPVEHVFKIIGKGWIFLVFIALTLSATMLVIVNPAIFTDSRFVTLYLSFFAASFALALSRERKTPLTGFGIEYLPRWFTQFFYAQLAIQIGMMYPLSAVYFQRFPIAGMYANFIAIPLIGLIVQYGLIAGLMDLIFTSIGLPSVGLSLALTVNAFNWLCCRLFLGMAAFFYRLFPYPYMAMPTGAQLALYYAGVLLFVFWRPLSYQVRLLYMRLHDVFDSGELKRRLFAGAAALVVLSAAVIAVGHATKRPTMRVTFFDVGFANSILVETPDRKTILIDTGTGGAWDSGSRVIAPTLAKHGIEKIDYLVLSTLKPNNIGGAGYLLTHWRAGKAYLPYNPEVLRYGAGYAEFLHLLGDIDLITRPRSSEATNTYLAWYELAKLMEQKQIPKAEAVQGEIIYERKFGDALFSVQVVNSPAAVAKDNAIAVRISYGETSILLPTQLGREAQWALLDYAAGLESDMLLLPKNGNPAALATELLESVKPQYAIIQYGFVPRARRTRDYFHESDLEQTYERLKSRNIKSIRTDENGAVVVTSDGESFSIKTVLN